MDLTHDCISGEELRPVEKSTQFQDASESCREGDEAANKRELTPRDEASGHSKSDSDIPSKEGDDNFNAAQQHPQEMFDEGTLAKEAIICDQYVRKHSPAFRELADLRQKGWSNPKGDEYFSKQRYYTDNADLKTSQNFLRMMTNVAAKMQEATGVFSLSAHRPAILGLGFAPGGFIAKALEVNPNAHAQGITLPHKNKGIPVLVRDIRLEVEYADITLMAGDLGFSGDAIPPDHPDVKNFLPKLIRPRAQFDLVTSEGGVLRPHQEQLGSHRVHREAQRLATAQLALALSRVKPGGRMIILMHKAEAWNNLCLLYTFHKFSNIRLFKPDKEHQHRSSFYMIATDIQSNSEAALAAVKEWKRVWKVTTFGTDEQCDDEARSNTLDIEKILEDFGEKWIELGTDVWHMQLEGLKQKAFAK